MSDYEAAALAAGMDPERIADAIRLIDGATAKGITPGAVAAFGRNGQTAVVHAVGAAHPAPPVEEESGSAPALAGAIPAAPDTIYDCASLTKVVATLPLILMLIDRGKLRLNDPVASYIPEFAAEGKEAITVKQLLTHTSGLASYLNLHADRQPPEQLKQRIYAQKLVYEPNTQVVYSDLGYITLGEIAALLWEMPLDEAARRHVFEPLGMRDTGFIQPAELRSRIAATEFRASLGRHKWGEVHDENADALGGICGHAGLFSTVGDLTKYALMWLDKGRMSNGKQLLSAAIAEAAVRTHTPSSLPGSNRGLGWVLKGDSMDASGDSMSGASYGHTGFTGTSLWIDPARQLFVVMLTNRVYYGRETSVVRLRSLVHNTLAASCLQ